MASSTSMQFEKSKQQSFVRVVFSSCQGNLTSEKDLEMTRSGDKGGLRCRTALIGRCLSTSHLPTNERTSLSRLPLSTTSPLCAIAHSITTRYSCCCSFIRLIPDQRALLSPDFPPSRPSLTCQSPASSPSQVNAAIMTSRKTQQEIEKTFKKVAEGMAVGTV